MKHLLTVIFLVGFAAFCSAVSIDEIIHLSKLKTSDELIIEIIQKKNLDTPATAADIIRLKEEGVSERVIQYVLKISSPSNPQKEALPRQESPSTWISDNMRSYYTTGKEGKKVRVITNLDEKGKRIGGEAPPPPPEPKKESYASSNEPREIYVTVRHEPSEEPEAEGRPYDEPPPQELQAGIPMSGYYPYYPSYYPYYPSYSPYSFPLNCCNHSRNFPPQNDVIARFDPRLARPPIVRSSPPPAPHASSAGARPRH